MGRKKKEPEPEKPFMVKCDICSQRVHHNAVVDGIIYWIDEEHRAICRDCGTVMLHVFKSMNQRWG